MTKKYLVLGLGLVGLTLAAQTAETPVEFHGYLRTGVGGSQGGGQQVAFELPGAPTKYRLGNETENYGEFELDYRIPLGDPNGMYMNLHTMATINKPYQSDSEAASSNVDLCQYWLEIGKFADGDVLKDATIWAGNRYYRRRNVDMTDFWYWNDSGMGFGIENVNLGACKLQFSVVNHRVPDSMIPQDDTTTDADGCKKSFSRASVWDYDLRFTGIKVSKDGELRISAMYAQPSIPDDVKEGVATVPVDNSGYALNVKHALNNLWGGNNNLVFTYGRGAMGSDLNFGSYQSTTYGSSSIPDVTADSSNKAWRALDCLTIAPTKQWDAQILGMHTEHKWNDLTTGESKTDVWTSVGMRPTYHFSDHFALAYEVGYDRISHSYDNLTPAMLKQTLAFEIINGRKYDSRPSLRFFVTHARWNNDARTCADAMNITDPTNGVYTISSNGAFGTHNSGTTFGVQAEICW